LDKVNRASVGARLREIQGDTDAKEESEVLDAWLKLSDREAALKRAMKDADTDLDAKAYAKYPRLTEAEIQTLVVDDKWLASLEAAIHGEMDSISQTLTARVNELAERYEAPMPALSTKLAELDQTVIRHLKRMGFTWEPDQATN
jgi:type I restriction enzyme M protein